MSKRRNENGQMRREEYEAAGDDDSGGENGGGFDGGFQRAPEAAIARRKIVTARGVAKRPAPTPTAPTPESATAPASAPKGNAFAGFSGLVTSEPAAPKANAFAGFTGLVASEPAPPKANPFAGFSGLTAAAPTQPSAPLAFGVAAPAPAASFSAAKASAPTTYQEAIEVLNKEFLDFVNQQLKKNPTSDWSAAVQDYAKHAQTIGVKFASTKPVGGSSGPSALAAARPLSVAPPAASSSSSSSVPSFTSSNKKVAPGASPSFSFGAKKDLPVPAASSSSNGFSFGASPPAKPAVVSGGFAFGNATSSTERAAAAKPVSSLFSFSAKPTEDKAIPAFSFGSPQPAATPEKPKPATGGFAFGASPAAAPASASSSGGFSFGATKPAASGGFSFSLSTTPAASSGGSLGPSSALTPSAAAEDEDEENIGREEATVILKSDNAEDDCVFEVDKAKILEFKKDEKRWADKGTHPLQVLVNKTTKNARILVRNEIGKIVLNSALYKGLAVKAHEAKGKKTGALLSLQVDASLTQFILKVNSEKVDAFLTALENATPK